MNKIQIHYIKIIEDSAASSATAAVKSKTRQARFEDSSRSSFPLWEGMGPCPLVIKDGWYKRRSREHLQSSLLDFYIQLTVFKECRT